MFGEHNSLGVRSYSGSWVNDVPSGQGSMAMEMANGEVYIGDIHDGKKNGNGKLSFGKDDKRLSYDGGWINDAMSGHGIMNWKNGDVYSGNWIYGKRSGHGTFTYFNGEKVNLKFPAKKRSKFLQNYAQLLSLDTALRKINILTWNDTARLIQVLLFCHTSSIICS